MPERSKLAAMAKREPFDPFRVPGPGEGRSPRRRKAGSTQPDKGGASSGQGPALVTVTQLTGMIRQAIEQALPPTMHIVGEISNFKRHGSGHLYFTLKDPWSELSCVMWRSSAASMKFEPRDGMEVIATGGVEVFQKAGRYQLYARKLEPRGVGTLELAFRQLVEKLSKEGLFDEQHKRPLPRYPRRIALVTSPTGAAVADMLRTIARRYPCVNVLLFPVRVQGEGAAGQIAAAIRKLNREAERLGGIDVMIVGRGGGSLEDLWAFNEEIVARAIFASTIPIISAVGHEVDVTIADLVADVRAATPTAAAEIAVPVLADVLADLAALEARMRRCVSGKVSLGRARLAGVTGRACFRDPLGNVRRREQFLAQIEQRLTFVMQRGVHRLRRRIEGLVSLVRQITPHGYLMRGALRLRDGEHRLREGMMRRIRGAERRGTVAAARLERSSPARALAVARERFEAASAALCEGVRHRLAMAREVVEKQDELLAALSHRSVLSRGFSITRIKRGRAVVRSAGQVKDGDRVETEVSEGTFESTVVNRQQKELFE
ncbi:MAG: exodeoxyribonuclease VII large subunit [Phycisphaerae bacterium]|nr:exodeoxyribonuclease VII large subunit [Phycisphaerae bacterium]